MPTYHKTLARKHAREKGFKNYSCRVKAMKIGQISIPSFPSGDERWPSVWRFFLFSEENEGCVDLGLAVEVGAHFIDKYSPVVGGYYVWQDDAPLCGRYIPASEFEIDYALVEGTD